MSSGSLDESAGTLSAADASEGSRLRRTFTLPRNPFSAVRVTKREPCVDSGATLGSDSNGGSVEPGAIERKLFRRGSWKRFISRIAHHMNTVAVPGVKNAPVMLKGEAGVAVGSAGVAGAEPPWPAGAVPAATGIRNHGNTCYMNAVLQCLSHTDIIAEYFVLDHYRLDLLKRNKINSKKYGTRGEVTEQLAALLKSLWACQYSADMSTSFKSTVERHGTQYRGNSQHDAQEFLFWLLDKVHEDLNTATKKKYKTIKNTCGKPDEVVAAETLANHARRNSSFVQTVFQAQYRSALTCGRCERTSCTFDPFHCVSVQLPPRHSAAQPSPLPVTVVYVNQQPRQVRIGLELSASATMEELRSTLHTDTGIPTDNIILAEISDAGWQATRGPWEGAGADIGQLYCIEAPSLLTTPTAPYLLLLWLNMLDGERFGSVYAMQVPRETSYADLQKLMLKEMAAVVPERVLLDAQDVDIFRARVLSLAHPHLHDDDSYLQSELPHPLFALGVEQALCGHDTHPHLRLELHWDARHRNSIMSETGEACEVHVSAETAAEGEETAPARPPLLTLHACLTHYTRAETLAQEDAWRCPQCQRYMPVVKTLGLWSLPDVLVIHLKRFRQQSKGRTSTKLTTMVEFPLTDFDMTPHLVRRSSTHESPGHSRSPRRRSRVHSVTASENVYDLYAVCYHHGDDLETGHYTAACKNPYNGYWYKFDDARVTLVPEDSAETELVNNTAYMLFYRRKKPNVAHVRPSDSHGGHWALRMPKYVKKQKPQMNGITESKEEAVEEMKEEPSESEVTVQTHSPSLSRSASSLPDDGLASPAGPRSLNESRSPSVRSPVKLVTPTTANVSTVEINGNVPDLEEDRLSVYENVTEPELYIHKDVHINPKMTPEIGRESASQRPRSVDYPTRAGSLGQKDMNRNYESSPYVASINGLEYDNSMSRDAPTTEELVLSMFHNETKYMMSRHQNINAHRPGEDATAWKTRIST